MCGSHHGGHRGVVELVAWVGAVLNTYRLADRTWFVVLLAGGLLGIGSGLIGFAVMVAYLIAGPDGTGIEAPQPLAPVQQPPDPVPVG